MYTKLYTYLNIYVRIVHVHIDVCIIQHNINTGMHSHSHARTCVYTPYSGMLYAHTHINITHNIHVCTDRRQMLTIQCTYILQSAFVKFELCAVSLLPVIKKSL